MELKIEEYKSQNSKNISKNKSKRAEAERTLWNTVEDEKRLQSLRYQEYKVKISSHILFGRTMWRNTLICRLLSI